MSMDTVAEYAAAYDGVIAALDAHSALPDDDRHPSPDEEPASEAVELTDAHQMLAEAAEAVPVVVLGEIWDANQQAVADAKQAIRDALANCRAVELEVVVAARSRDPQHPVLTQNEQETCRAAFDAYSAAVQTHAEAIAAFKAGITPAQIEERL